MKTVRASEIGVYLYCQRAWWYQRQGIENVNQADLAAGSLLHVQHGQRVVAAGCLRSSAALLLLAGLVTAAIALIYQIL
jgi:hypothetical protein